MVAGSSEIRVRRTMVHRMRTPVAVGELTAAIGAMRSAVVEAAGPDGIELGSDWAMVEGDDEEVTVSTILSDAIEGDPDPEMPLAMAMAALTQIETALGQDDRPDMRRLNLELAQGTLTQLVHRLGGPR